MAYLNGLSVSKLIDNGEVGILPYVEQFQGPNLYYCHLGSKLLIPKKGMLADTSGLASDLYDKKTLVNFYDLAPGEFILAETFETFMTDQSHIIRLFNSSSLARLGVVQCAVGMINPGCGIKKPLRMTLELSNTGPFTVRLYPTSQVKDGGVHQWGTEVLKVAVAEHEKTAIAYEDWHGTLYGSDSGVTGSKIDRRFK